MTSTHECGGCSLRHVGHQTNERLTWGRSKAGGGGEHMGLASLAAPDQPEMPVSAKQEANPGCCKTADHAAL